MKLLAPSNRLRRTWWSDAVEAAGVSAYTVYNKTLLPVVFDSISEDCRHLKTAVQIWDVACERQIRIEGPDADALMQRLTPRDLERVKPGKCAYVPICDVNGGMLNDPVALQPRPGVWWISLADSDLALWVEGVAMGGGYDVSVSEPDVQILGLQGPLATELAAEVFGEETREIPFFGFLWLPFGDGEVLVARSGYSKQGGFEIYVPDAGLAMPLWDRLWAAGEQHDIRAGCPNAIERIEGGMLSYGNDMNRADTPFEAGLGRYVQRYDCIGGAALRAHTQVRQIVAIELSEAPPVCDREWALMDGDVQAGRVRSAAWSDEFQCGVAVGMVGMDWGPGDRLTCVTQDSEITAEIRERFWR
ncbi:dimethylsulfoniopropionate demethylase [Jannaschia faecimaris]|uniref:Dimethylsulfoniopropionate demethylase n=1 Tax=Jannaschia faecimaris TaxID=1244108 RepID=A0A1H3S3W8_9RHOB|nr:dimethylsulfoniopropionate demethylase [Jannaschia faecimaris]SDZ32632.1 dimethylsulfoniopropionate demethylase [Jannaschia faecimaris]